MQPPEGAAVVCVDEKTGMQALERKYETKLPLPGRPGKYEHEYIRHGTVSLLASFEIQTGEVIFSSGATRTGSDLIAFMDEVAKRYKDRSKIVVVRDNLTSTYTTTVQTTAGRPSMRDMGESSSSITRRFTHHGSTRLRSSSPSCRSAS